eukprot:TRINITY_DN13800_c0_g1_i1.p1 TRINITY_DN13800_c0_g1~~TRINITY_DN13800_c0_g1_i1.p1  ORF type:complete len:605 (+),score=88.70 TRINITY_DN13800_c0_g1_i1:78-1892(+)
MMISDNKRNIESAAEAFSGTDTSTVPPEPSSTTTSDDSRFIMLLMQQLRHIRSAAVVAERICADYDKFGSNIVEDDVSKCIGAQSPRVPNVPAVGGFFLPLGPGKQLKHPDMDNNIRPETPAGSPRLLTQSPEPVLPPQVTVVDVISDSESAPGFGQVSVARMSCMTTDFLKKEMVTTEAEPEPKGAWQMRAGAMVKSYPFDCFFMVMVVCNSVFIAVQVDFQTRYPKAPTQLDQYIVSVLFGVIFTVELVARIISEGGRFCFGSPNMAWHWFDSFFVGMSWMEAVVGAIAISRPEAELLDHNLSSARIFRMVRMSRLLRVIRMARAIRIVTSLKTLVLSIAYTMKVAGGALVLLFMNITVFALLLTSAVAEYKASLPAGAMVDADLDAFWGRLHVSMLTLFEISANGLDSHAALSPLFQVGGFWVFMFLVYVIGTVFCMLNVITGLFCECSIQAARKCQDVAIEEILANRDDYVRDARKLFSTFDKDESGLVAAEDLMMGVLNPRSAAFFEFLDVRVCDAYELVRLASEGGSTKFEFDDFVEALLRLKGSARAIDIERVMREQQSTRDTIMGALQSLGAIVEGNTESTRNAIVVRTEMQGLTS